MVKNFPFTVVYNKDDFIINKAVPLYGDSCSVPTLSDRAGAVIFITRGSIKILSRDCELETTMQPFVLPTLSSGFLSKEGAVLVAETTSTYHCISHREFPVGGSLINLTEGETIDLNGNYFVATGALKYASGDPIHKATTLREYIGSVTATEDTCLAKFYIEE